MDIILFLINLLVIVAFVFIILICIFSLIHILGFCFYKLYMCFEKLYIHCTHIEIPQKGICSICLNEVFTIPLECGHVFHTKCINKWLEQNNTCPNCRCEV